MSEILSYPQAETAEKCCDAFKQAMWGATDIEKSPERRLQQLRIAQNLLKALSIQVEMAAESARRLIQDLSEKPETERGALE